MLGRAAAVFAGGVRTWPDAPNRPGVLAAGARNYRLGASLARTDAGDRGLPGNAPRAAGIRWAIFLGRKGLSEQEPTGPQPWGGRPQRGQQHPWGNQQQPAPPPQWGEQPQWGNQQRPAPPPQWGVPPLPDQQPRWDQQPQWGQQTQWDPRIPGQPGHPQAPYGQPRYVAPPKPGIVPLRPLMLGEILDGSFQTVRRNPAAMLGAGVIAQALGSVVSALAQTGVVSGWSPSGWLEGITPSQAVALGLGIAGVGFVLMLLSVLISVIVQGAMAVPVARSLLNRRTGFRQMWSLSRSRMGALLGLAGLLILGVAAVVALSVLVTMALVAALGRSAPVALVLLFFGLVVVLVWLAVRFLVAPAAIVVEELGPFAGLRRSWQLTGGNWWRLLGISLVVGLLVGVLSQIVLLPVKLLGNALGFTVFSQGGDGADHTVGVAVALVSTVVTALVAAVGFAFQTSTMALVYLDLRMRKDGLDLSLMRQLETGSDPDGVPGRAPAAILGAPAVWQRPPYGPPPVR